MEKKKMLWDMYSGPHEFCVKPTILEWNKKVMGSTGLKEFLRACLVCGYGMGFELTRHLLFVWLALLKWGMEFGLKKW